jgi:predicted RNA-binding protein with TRAM domain
MTDKIEEYGVSRYGAALIREFITFVQESEAKNPVGVKTDFVSPGAFFVEYYYEQTTNTDD